MTVKEIAKQTIDELPEEAIYDDILEAIYIRAKFEMGLQEILDGNGISHEEATQRIMKWVR